VNIFRHELWSYRKSTLIWAISLSAISLLFLLLYPAFAGDATAAKKVLGNLPPGLRSALGISLQNFFTVFGFFGYLFTYVVLAGAIQAMNLGVGAISREDSGKTADFLLTKPVGRATIVTAKLLACITALMATNVVFIIASYLAARVVSTQAFSARTFVLISATLMLVQLMFLALGFVLAATLPKIKSVITVSLPTVFSFFIIGTVGSIIGTNTVRYITPFKFYDVAYIIAHNTYETRFLLIEAAFIVVALAATYGIYLHKDIRASS